MLHMLKRKRRWKHRLFLFVCGGGCLLPPAAYFLPSVFLLCLRRVTFFQQRKKVTKERQQKPMVSALPSRCVRAAALFRRSRELTSFYSRCRFIGRLKGLTTLPSENSSPQSHCHSEETAEVPPVADTARLFRGSVPIFTPQRGWKSADTTVQTVRRLVVGTRIPRR